MFKRCNVFILKKVLEDLSYVGPCFDNKYWWYVFVDFELMNVFQSMKFCVMEDNRLTKRVESFLESFAHGFSSKKHFFSQSVMFTKILCFFYLTSFKIGLFLF